MTRQELRAQGEATLKALFGTTEQARGFANLLTEPVYGGVWNRPGLELCRRDYVRVHRPAGTAAL